MAFAAMVLNNRKIINLARITLTLTQRTQFFGSENNLEQSIRTSIQDNNQDHLMWLIRQSIQTNNYPSPNIITAVLGYIEERTPELDTNLRLLKARLFWAQGNIDKALAALEDIHEMTHPEDVQIKLYTRNMLHDLVQEALQVKSEAVLLKTCSTIEKLNELAVLENLWQSLFLSHWFSDQQLAKSLFGRHESLRRRFAGQKNYFTFLLLKEHNLDAVYRLIELLLAHNMQFECKNVLGLLFDYQCRRLICQFSLLLIFLLAVWRRDLRSCSEIIQTSIGLGLELETDPNYGKKLIRLMLSSKESQKTTTPSSIPKPPDFKF